MGLDQLVGLLDGIHLGAAFRGGKAVLLEHIHGFIVGGQGAGAYAVGKKGQGPFGGYLGVQLAQGTGGGVPGIGKFPLPVFQPLLVEHQEGMAGHIHFAPDVQEFRNFLAGNGF